MGQFARGVVGAGLSVCMAACGADLTIPPEAEIICEGGTPCPSGWTCRESIGRCVPVGTDERPPALDGVPDLGPEHATVGTEIRLTLKTDAPLFRPPEAVLQSAAGSRFEIVRADPEDDGWTLRHVVHAIDGEGHWPVVVTLVDTSGNVATLTVGSVELDFTAPSLVGPVSADPAVIGPGGTVALGLTFTEPLIAPPEVLVHWPDDETAAEIEATFVSADDAATPTYVMEVLVPAGLVQPTGLAHARITALDRAGNEATLERAAGFHVDASPPAVVRGSELLHLLPDPSNPLRGIAEVEAATHGTTVRVGFTLDEPDMDEPQVVSGVNRLTFDLLEQSGTSYVFERTLDANDVLVDGPETIEVTTTDAHGNTRAPFTLLEPETDEALVFPIVTSAPAPPPVDAPEQVVYHRAPWGHGGDETPTFWITAADGAAEPGTWLVAFEGPEVSVEGRIGFARVSDSGSVDEIVLGRVDRTEVHVAVIDGAGNASFADPAHQAPRAVRVRDVSWTATLGGKVALDTFHNPHRLMAYRIFEDRRRQAVGSEIAAEHGVSTIGTGGVVTRGAASWQHATLPAAEALPRLKAPTAAYDPTLGRGLLFGGEHFCQFPGDLYVRDGDVWTFPARSAVRPPSVGHDAMVYSAGRERMVLFTGEETWEWKDQWLRVCDGPPCADEIPSGREGHAMAYDPARRVVVLFGGRVAGEESGETWEWDGRWRRVCTDDACAAGAPSARSQHAMAYDGNLGEVLVHGGTSGEDELWSFDGARWLRRCTDAPCADEVPAGRQRHAMAWDGARGEVVLFSGASDRDQPCADDTPPAADTWAWTGSEWILREAPSSPGAPPGRRDHALYYDSGRRMVVLVAGSQEALICPGICVDPEADPGMTDTWEWDGTSWRESLDVTALPSSFDHAAAHHPGRGTLVAAGGELDFHWEWSGSGWSFENSASIESHGLRLVTLGEDVFAFGGTDYSDYFASPSLLTSTGWTAAPTGGGPSPAGRAWHAMASDGETAVVFGGDDGLDQLDDTWHYTLAGGWQRRCQNATTCPRPPARSHGALAWTGRAGEMLLFGGQPGNWGGSDDTWLWNGADWVAQMPSASPPPRLWHQMAYDPSRDAVVLVGGIPTVSVTPGWTFPPGYETVWEWREGEWHLAETIDATGDGDPPGSTWGGSLDFDATRRQMVLHGGYVNAEGSTPFAFTDGETWLWRSGGDDRPAQIFSAVFGASGAGAVSLVRLEADWYGAATSFDGDTESDAVDLAVWDVDRWLVLDTISPSAEDPRVRWSSDVDTYWSGLAPAHLARLFTGSASTLDLALLPRHTNGPAGDYARIETDYVEVRVLYRLDP